MAWILRKLMSTVLPEIISPVALFTLIATAVTVGCKISGYKMALSTIMLSIITTLVSFALSLRTSSAVERFNDGRKAWSQITRASRDLATMIWIHLPPTTLTAAELTALKAEDDSKLRLEIEEAKGLLEKRTYINLVQAFSVAAKHYIRGESGLYYADLYHLVAPLPRYSFPSSIEERAFDDADGTRVSSLWRSPGPNGAMNLPYDREESSAATSIHDVSVPGTCKTEQTAYFHSAAPSKAGETVLELGQAGRKVRKIYLAPASNPPPPSVYHYAPMLKMFRPVLRVLSKTLGRGDVQPRRRPVIESNVPLELLLFLNGYVSTLIARETLPVPFIGLLFGHLSLLQDSLVSLERVLTTPLPFQYDIHLKASTWFFLLILPFQIYSNLGWITIPAQFIASILFCGWLELGRELEQPFGYDDSDLDLDHFCELIAAELREIATHPQPSPAAVVLSPHNTPFLPTDPRSAPEILADLAQTQNGSGEASRTAALRKVLAKHYHECERFSSASKRDTRRRQISTPSRSIDVYDVV